MSTATVLPASKSPITSTELTENLGAPSSSQSSVHLSHIMSPSTLLTVFGMLVGLTLVTVAAAQVSFGAWEVWVSLGIASIKATLVAVYFMHLRHDKPFNGVVFVSSLMFVALFLGLTLMDLQS